ncbi:helix-turn-helix domain-containing protein [Streptomyces sp. NPDC005227]|uniref:helix-turn-helix domain-containing protein n=1 Tax=Streptomyces sp. NPDC005227 TaxID=3364707 RepID=UPI0036C5C584
MTPDELDARVASEEESDHQMMQIINEESERQKVDFDPPHPLDGLDTESLASFNLKQIRTTLGMSQQQIADQLAAHRAAGHHDVKLSQTQIAKIERGERPWRLNELVAIAAALGVEMGEFFSGQPASRDGDMLVLTAKLKYQRAKAAEENAREELRAAIRASYRAEEELIRLCAKYEIGEPEVIGILALRGNRSFWAELTKDEDSERVSGHSDHLEERKEYAKEFVAKEWSRLVQEETGHPPTQRFGDPDHPLI